MPVSLLIRAALWLSISPRTATIIHQITDDTLSKAGDAYAWSESEDSGSAEKSLCYF